jgi:hypothetical protein
MMQRNIRCTITVKDRDESGIATDCGATEEIVTKLLSFVLSLDSDYVTVDVNIDGIEDAEELQL